MADNAQQKPAESAVKLLLFIAPQRAAALGLFLRLPIRRQNKGVLQRAVFQPRRAADLAAVAGGHVGGEQQQRIALLEAPQLRHPFGRLPILHLRVGKPLVTSRFG